MCDWRLLIPMVGIAATGAAGAAPAGKPAPGPKIRFAVRQHEPGTGNLLRFTLRPGPRDAGTVHAYQPGPAETVPAGYLSPLYQVELLQNGKWKDHLLGWCGTGASQVKLAPSAELYFTVPVPPGKWQAMRVGVSWTSGARNGARPQTLWSEAVPRVSALGHRR